MAVSRNARRRASKMRQNMALCDRLNRQAIEGRKAIVAANLSRSPRRDNSRGMVSGIYSGTAQPQGRAHSKRYSKGVIVTR